MTIDEMNDDIESFESRKKARKLCLLEQRFNQPRTMSSPDPHTATVFYKVLTNEEFAASLQSKGPWSGTLFDQSVTPSAIHLATALHTPEVLTMRFSDQESVWVLAIPRSPRKVNTKIGRSVVSLADAQRFQGLTRDWIGSRSKGTINGA